MPNPLSASFTRVRGAGLPLPCLRGVALLALALLPGCRKAAASSEPSEHAGAPVVLPPATPPSAAAIVPKDDVAALFRAEARQRPASGVHVEDALAAFAAAHVPVSDVRQHLAKPFGALYCAGAEAPESVALSVCEYADATAANAGRAAALKGLASIPNRSVSVNGATTLTLRERSRTSESRSVASALERAFDGIKK